MARESARSKDTAKPGIKEVAAVAGVSPYYGISRA